MFRSAWYENSRPDGFGVLEVVGDAAAGPERKRKNGGEPQRRFVPLQRTELKGEVLGPVAALRLVQTYGYAQAQSDKVLEAVYRFPLPGDAAVTGVRVRFGEVEIRAELKEREAAEATCQEAKQQGQQAALLTRESPDVFTLQIAGLKPDETVVVETSYVQLARAEGAGWSLRLPLTTAPRYTRGDEREARHAQGQPLFVTRDPGHRFALDLLFPTGGSVQSHTHQLEVTPLTALSDSRTINDSPESPGLRAQLREGEVVPDRDCVLTWNLPQGVTRPSLQVLLHDEPSAEHIYFLALIAPPATHERESGVAREIVLLVDHSGSMTGPKWAASDWAVQCFLTDLTERDTFALGLFHNTTRWFKPSPSRADAKTTQAAIDFLTEHRDSGGTELGVALEQALRLPRAPGQPARHVLIVTDAEVTDAGRVLRLADDEAQRRDRRRVSVLCIDAAPNSFLAGELAERSGGAAKFLTSDPDQEDVTTALDEVLADWAEPVLTGLRLEVNHAAVEAAGRTVVPQSLQDSAIDLGDLPLGRVVWVAGRVPRGSQGNLTFRLASQDQEIASTLVELQPAPDGETNLNPDASREHPALKSLFGARRVAGLEFLMHSAAEGDELAQRLARLGYDPAQHLISSDPQTPAPLYVENSRAATQEALRALLVREALDYGLASAETAFVVVREEAGKVVEDTVPVGNALPQGWPAMETMDWMVMPSLMASAGPASPPPLAASTMPLYGMPNRKFKRSLRRSQAAGSSLQSALPEPSLASATLLFAGLPDFEHGEAVLFDSTRAEDAAKLATAWTISGLVVRFPAGMPPLSQVDAALSLLIFVDDLVSPRAKVRLLDVLRGGGERPLNIAKAAGQVVRIVLVDASGAWQATWGTLEISART